jgi:hypothetical protein
MSNRINLNEPTKRDNQEFKVIKEEITKKETNQAQNSKQKNQSDLILELIEESNDLTLFCDEFKEPFAKVYIKDHFEILKCSSKQFLRWINKKYWDQYEKVPNTESVKSAIKIIEAKAVFDSSRQIKLNNRVAKKNNKIYYDLTNNDWQAVEATADGWKILNHPPTLFKRYAHQKDQVFPKSPGDVFKLDRFINIKDQNDRLLLYVFIITCFIPEFPHPVLNVYGPQGSAKSFLSKLLRAIIDPSKMEVCTLTNNANELIQVLDHHWFIFFDNISYISQKTSDNLCKAVTGAGFSKRELYSNDDDIIYNFKRCIGLNGINLISEKPDLLERSLLIELTRIPTHKRKSEEELLKSFKVNLPEILGGIFTILTKTLSLKPNVKLEYKPRMADFAEWGEAVSQALGFTKNLFLKAYSDNIGKQNEEVLLNNTVGLMILKLMYDRSEWQGTASDLLIELKRTAEKFEIDINKDKSFPLKENALSRKINLIKPNLGKENIKIVNKKGMQREIIISKIENKTADTVLSSETAKIEEKETPRDQGFNF